MNTSSHGVRDAGGGINRQILTNAQNTLNTTVWNSSIVREQTTHSSPPLEKYEFLVKHSENWQFFTFIFSTDSTDLIVLSKYICRLELL